MDKKVAPSTNSASGVRAKSFKVSTTSLNFEQYARTIRAYSLAGMTFTDIANAGDFLGDLVERQEIDSPLQEGWQERMGEIVEDESKILAWQSRGEKVSLTPQLSAGTAGGNELVIVSRQLTNTQTQSTTIDVLEGIKVIREDNEALENNPYLKPLPEFENRPKKI